MNTSIKVGGSLSVSISHYMNTSIKVGGSLSVSISHTGIHQDSLGLWDCWTIQELGLLYGRNWPLK
jgi:hypothetical protein